MDMEIIRAATDWAKAEVFSTQFFILFGCIFILSSVGFWQLGKTELARAYIIPTLIAGCLLVIIGLGLYFSNTSRLKSFSIEYNKDAAAFLESELARAESTQQEYKTVVFRIIPILMAVCALGIVFLNTPVWRASLITAIAMFAIILMIDGTADARIHAYKDQLLILERHLED